MHSVTLFFPRPLGRDTVGSLLACMTEVSPQDLATHLDTDVVEVQCIREWLASMSPDQHTWVKTSVGTFSQTLTDWGSDNTVVQLWLKCRRLVFELFPAARNAGRIRPWGTQ